MTHFNLSKLVKVRLTALKRCESATDRLRFIFRFRLQVGYEAGAGGERLPDFYMNDLDNELIPVIHSAAVSSSGGAPVCIELIFHVID